MKNPDPKNPDPKSHDAACHEPQGATSGTGHGAKRNEPPTVMCTYRVKSGKEAEFVKLLEKHHPTLLRLGLATAERPLVYRGRDQQDKPYFVEIFTWQDPAGPERAHHHPEVMAIWEPMGALCEERGGRPMFEFPHVEPVTIQYPKA